MNHYNTHKYIFSSRRRNGHDGLFIVMPTAARPRNSWLKSLAVLRNRVCLG